MLSQGGSPLGPPPHKRKGILWAAGVAPATKD